MKFTRKNIASRLSIGAAACALTAGVAVLATPTETEAAFRPIFFPCACPLVYAPVRCDGDLVFSNQCFANCAGATGCVPDGIFF